MLHGEGGIWGKIQGVWPHWSFRKSVPGRGNGGEGKSSEARACLPWSKRNMELALFGVEGGRGE